MILVRKVTGLYLPRVLDEIEQKGEFVKQSATAVFKYCYDGTNYAYLPLAGCKGFQRW